MGLRVLEGGHNGHALGSLFRRAVKMAKHALWEEARMHNWQAEDGIQDMPRNSAKVEAQTDNSFQSEQEKGRFIGET